MQKNLIGSKSRDQPEVNLGLVQTTWGWVGVAWTVRGLCGLELPGDPSEVQRVMKAKYPQAVWGEVPQVYALPLQRYFAGEPVEFQFGLDYLGRQGFFVSAWEAARTVAYGSVVSYAQLAAMAGRPGAARAAGSAMAANPIPVVVPCHRVVAARGMLGGYGAGLEWKLRLLALEGALLPHR